jgi:hypothetical protein
MSAFENLFRNLPAPQKGVIIDVTDTARFARKWLDDSGMEYTTSELLTLTGQILSQLSVAPNPREVTWRL